MIEVPFGREVPVQVHPCVKVLLPLMFFLTNGFELKTASLIKFASYTTRKAIVLKRAGLFCNLFFTHWMHISAVIIYLA